MLEKLIQNPRQSTLMYFILLLICIVWVYYPSLSVPFYLDDEGSIINSVAIHATSLDLLLQSGLERRFIGYLSLWANYQVGGLDPLGYHVVNILIHIINSLLVFVLVLRLIRYFHPTEHAPTRYQQVLLVMAVAAIWALHPLNTQAVTYVVQRLASIVTVFYILTIICYIPLRQHPFTSEHKGKNITYAVLLIGSIIGGLHAKQNFVAVLVFLYCWELLTCSAHIRRYLLTLSLWIGLLLLLLMPFIPDFWLMLDNLTRETHAISRVEYFYTQQVVLWDYVWRFIYPFSLQLNIDIVLQKSLTPLVALAMLGHIVVLSIVYYYRKLIPLLIVGVVFFYTSHLIESFIFPITDLAFEHRTYIGNIGLLLALAGLAQFWWQQKRPSKTIYLRMMFTVSGLLLIFSITTAKRNILWQTPLEFYANEVAQAPQQSRANASYGNELMKLGRFDEAEPYLKKSVDINLAKNKMTASGLTAYLTVLYHNNDYQKAAVVAMLGLKYINKPLERSNLLGKLAYGYIQMGMCDFAKGLLSSALDLDPNNREARKNLDVCLLKLKQLGR